MSDGEGTHKHLWVQGLRGAIEGERHRFCVYCIRTSTWQRSAPTDICTWREGGWMLEGTREGERQAGREKGLGLSFSQRESFWSLERWWLICS